MFLMLKTAPDRHRIGNQEKRQRRQLIVDRKERVSLALSKELIKLIDKRRGRASRSAEVEYLIKIGLEHEKKGRGSEDYRISLAHERLRKYVM
jgi:hypothetical protein